MGPKDTPFEGGVFAAKLTFVSPLPRTSSYTSLAMTSHVSSRLVSRPTTRSRPSRCVSTRLSSTQTVSLSTTYDVNLSRYLLVVCAS